MLGWRFFWCLQPRLLIMDGNNNLTNVGAFKAFKVAICHILTLQKIDTYQPEVDRGKFQIDQTMFGWLFSWSLPSTYLIVDTKQQFDQCLAHKKQSKWQRNAFQTCRKWTHTGWDKLKLCLDDCFPGFLPSTYLIVDTKQQFNPCLVH